MTTTIPCNNFPRLLSASAVTGGTITITALPPDPGGQIGAFNGSTPGGAANLPSALVLNDSTSVGSANSGNQIGNFPFGTLARLGLGGIIQLGNTSNGLVLSQMPPGVAINVAF